MNIEAFCASRQLARAIEHFMNGRLTAALDCVRRAKHAVDRMLDEATEQTDAPHSDACLCRSCHEAELEGL